MNLNILVLPGDGIGTEVTREAVRVLRHVAQKWNHALKLTEGLLGGIAIHQTGNPLPEETVRLAGDADATLMGAVGLPEFDNAPPEKRPEKAFWEFAKCWGFTRICGRCVHIHRCLIRRLSRTSAWPGRI